MAPECQGGERWPEVSTSGYGLGLAKSAASQASAQRIETQTLPIPLPLSLPDAISTTAADSGDHAQGTAARPLMGGPCYACRSRLDAAHQGFHAGTKTWQVGIAFLLAGPGGSSVVRIIEMVVRLGRRSSLMHAAYLATYQHWVKHILLHIPDDRPRLLVMVDALTCNHPWWAKGEGWPQKLGGNRCYPTCQAHHSERSISNEARPLPCEAASPSRSHRN